MWWVWEVEPFRRCSGYEGRTHENGILCCYEMDPIEFYSPCHHVRPQYVSNPEEAPNPNTTTLAHWSQTPRLQNVRSAAASYSILCGESCTVKHWEQTERPELHFCSNLQLCDFRQGTHGLTPSHLTMIKQISSVFPDLKTHLCSWSVTHAHTATEQVTIC